MYLCVCVRINGRKRIQHVKKKTCRSERSFVDLCTEAWQPRQHHLLVVRRWTCLAPAVVNKPTRIWVQQMRCFNQTATCKWKESARLVFQDWAWAPSHANSSLAFLTQLKAEVMCCWVACALWSYRLLHQKWRRKVFSRVFSLPGTSHSSFSGWILVVLLSAAGSCYVLDDLINYIDFNPFKQPEMAIYSSGKSEEATAKWSVSLTFTSSYVFK